MTESCRLITTEQYQEYLKLKEEHKPLSWEELKEEAKKMGALIYKDEICFEYDGGELYISYWNDGRVEADLTIIAQHRTPDQMLAIMKALQ